MLFFFLPQACPSRGPTTGFGTSKDKREARNRRQRRAQACQQNADATFAVAIAVPVIAAVCAAAWILRAPPRDKVAAGQIFSDPETGNIFDAGADASPERDKKVRCPSPARVVQAAARGAARAAVTTGRIWHLRRI